ncbi:hypothetical protein T484DRAFT_1795558 [Baffinella frigidus]|nr:hypothetical protein T484DRAFT_1795558 [Cryptophyta sp. CCMP2293]
MSLKGAAVGREGCWVCFLDEVGNLRESWHITFNVHPYIPIPPGAPTLRIPLSTLLPPLYLQVGRARLGTEGQARLGTNGPAAGRRVVCIVSRADFLVPEGGLSLGGGGGGEEASVSLAVNGSSSTTWSHIRLFDPSRNILFPLIRAGPPLEARRQAVHAEEEEEEVVWDLDDPIPVAAAPPQHDAWFRLEVHRAYPSGSLLATVTVFVSVRSPRDFAALSALATHANWRTVFALPVQTVGDAEFSLIEVQRKFFATSDQWVAARALLGTVSGTTSIARGSFGTFKSPPGAEGGEGWNRVGAGKAL